MSCVEETKCCALAHLRCDNNDPVKEIENTMIMYITEEKNCETGDHVSFMAVTCDNEKDLEKTLAKVGFEHKHTIPSYYKPGHDLKLWFYTYEQE